MLFFSVWLLSNLGVQAAVPVVSNIRASQRAGTQLVDIYYNVTATTPAVKVSIMVSPDGGVNWNVPAYTFTGAYGTGVTPGKDRLVTWNAGADWAGRFTSACRVRVLADDGSAPPAPAGMVYIPAGTFRMGDGFFEGTTDELPVHSVFVSAFFMDKSLITKEEWLDVFSWAAGNRYSFSNSGIFTAITYPVHTISWYDAVKWCNARSEKEGLTPCYYTDTTLANIYRNGVDGNIANAWVKWTANGYRLPTEAEWEKAARGGKTNKRFPWGDTITHAQANYFSSSIFSYDLSSTRGAHPIYGDGSSPVGSFAANDYGLFDMTGNLFEWCWDGYDSAYYGRPGATNDPHGPVGISSARVLRGGAWVNYGGTVNVYRCAARIGFTPTGSNWDYIGFRCVRGF